MKALVVEDDFTSRKLVQRILSGFGETDVAVDGEEALDAFDQALEEGVPYDLICLDVVMPKLTGHEVLQEIRDREEDRGVDPEHGVKIIMTTGLDDKKSILEAFRDGCEAYLTKPISRADLLSRLGELGLIEE